MKLRMLMTRSALGGAYALSILGSTLHMFTGISGDFAELSEHEASSKTAQDRRDTRDSVRSHIGRIERGYSPIISVGIFQPKFGVPFLTNRVFAGIREFG